MHQERVSGHIEGYPFEPKPSTGRRPGMFVIIQASLGDHIRAYPPGCRLRKALMRWQCGGAGAGRRRCIRDPRHARPAFILPAREGRWQPSIGYIANWRFTIRDLSCRRRHDMRGSSASWRTMNKLIAQPPLLRPLVIWALGVGIGAAAGAVPDSWKQVGAFVTLALLKRILGDH
jgi:hypothetical protein